METGVDPIDFWEYTLNEMNLMLEAYKARLKTQAQMNYSHAATIRAGVANVLDGKHNTFPKIHEVYPGLFDAPVSHKQDWRVAAERLRRFAAAHNAKRGKK